MHDEIIFNDMDDCDPRQESLANDSLDSMGDSTNVVIGH